MARKTIAQLLKEREQIDARIKEIRAQEEKVEREARNKFHHVLAGDVESVLGDWRQIDLDAFIDWFRKVAPEARAACMLSAERTAEEAKRAAIEHERAGQRAARERAKERRAAMSDEEG